LFFFSILISWQRFVYYPDWSSDENPLPTSFTTCLPFKLGDLPNLLKRNQINENNQNNENNPNVNKKKLLSQDDDAIDTESSPMLRNDAQSMGLLSDSPNNRDMISIEGDNNNDNNFVSQKNTQKNTQISFSEKKNKIVSTKSTQKFQLKKGSQYSAPHNDKDEVEVSLHPIHHSPTLSQEHSIHDLDQTNGLYGSIASIPVVVSTTTSTDDSTSNDGSLYSPPVIATPSPYFADDELP
jgi:hypothetical protein